ncbi:MAG: ankyrin repeat domain-containing protein [Fimbriiglobus sp.]
MKDEGNQSPQAVSAVNDLSIAATNGKLKELKLLLEAGAAINEVAKPSGRNALHSAALAGQLKCVEHLIAAGADLNAIDSDGMTALMDACHLGKVKGSAGAMMLIQAGADVRCVRSGDKMTALKFAVKTCTPEVIRALIQKGAEVDGPEGAGMTALMLAARENNVEALRILVDNGADLSIPCSIPWAGGRTAEGSAEMEKKRAALTFLREARIAAGG